MLNLSGLISAQLQDARGHSDEDFKVAIRDGSIDKLLSSLPVELDTGRHRNQIVYPTNAMYFYRHLGGDDPGFQTVNGGFFFGRAYLATDTSQWAWTDYQDQDHRDWNDEINTVHPGSGTTSRILAATPVAYGLVEEARVTEESNTPTGLRAVHLTNTWLWLPSDANTSNIRAFRINSIGATDPSSTAGEYQNTMMQHRFVDSGGNPITITKNADQTFCVRWTQTFKSI